MIEFITSKCINFDYFYFKFQFQQSEKSPKWDQTHLILNFII